MGRRGGEKINDRELAKEGVEVGATTCNTIRVACLKCRVEVSVMESIVTRKVDSDIVIFSLYRRGALNYACTQRQPSSLHQTSPGEDNKERWNEKGNRKCTSSRTTIDVPPPLGMCIHKHKS